jgi:hypothetical protein
MSSDLVQVLDAALASISSDHWGGYPSLQQCVKTFRARDGVPQEELVAIEQRATALYNLARKCHAAETKSMVLVRLQVCQYLASFESLAR